METERAMKRMKISNDDGYSSEEEYYDYEVFLSFRGEDTRKTFTDHLYAYLTDARIRTFRDNEELHVGEQIGPELVKAIEQSKILIPTFSREYASSKWCLFELAHMVKCMEKKGSLIYPIFYDVTPSETKHQTGRFERAFCQHVKEFDARTVEEWKEALKKVSALKGWEKDQIANGHEAVLVKMIGLKVLVELKKNYVDVTENLVGTDYHVQKLMELLHLSSNDVRIIGIHGMGGIGKTTLAKVAYNKLCDKFQQQCSFVDNVREKANQRCGLINMQEQLLSDIFKVDNCRIMMKKGTLRSTKVLIVLDDVDLEDQLNGVIGKRDYLGPGSRIIVTTRNKDIFKEHGEGDGIYELEEMDSDNSLRLFSKWAFRSERPSRGYEAISKEVVSYASGLPLTLVVIGSLLCTKKRELWEPVLKKLSIVMPAGVQERLKISYDALDHGQQQIFLDIACHFIGQGIDDIRSQAFYMWESCGFFPEIGIDALISMSLLKIGNDNVITMHDQLRDLGRDIVWKESHEDPGERSRLWDDEVALEVLWNRTGTKKVQTLDLVKGDCFSNEEFKGLSNLRYLNIGYSNIEGDFKGLFSKLRWFRWISSCSQMKLTNFYPHELVILDLSNSEISDDWDGCIQVATNLKVLDLSYCWHLTKTPDFSAFPYLERLNLEGCSKLAKLSPSIVHLKRLTYLNTRNCSFVIGEELPEKLGSMEALTQILMDRSLKALGMLNFRDEMKFRRSEIPDSIGSLRKLQHLSLGGWFFLRNLPESLWKLESLVELNLNSVQITNLSEAIGNLTDLKSLNISSTPGMKLPDSIGMLEKLEELSAGRCTSLKEIPDSIGNLKNLRVLRIGGSKVELLPTTIGMLEKLEELNASYCRSLTRLPDTIGNLRSLTNLRLTGCAIKKLPIGIGMLQKLEELHSEESSLEGDLPSGIWNLSSLKVLKLNNTKVSSLPTNICGLASLLTLDLRSCDDLQLPLELKLPLSLMNLSIPLTMASLDSVVSLVNIRSIRFHRSASTELVEIAKDFSNLSNLVKLSFLEVSNINSLPLRFVNISPLKDLYFKHCRKLQCLRIPSNLQSLGTLKLRHCTSLESVIVLSTMDALRYIEIDHCPELCDIKGIVGATSLEDLTVWNCASLGNLPDLSNLKRLKMLEVSCCEKLQEIKGLESLTSLETLDLRDCTSLKPLPNLSNLRTLWYKRIENCGEAESSDCFPKKHPDQVSTSLTPNATSTSIRSAKS